MKAKAWLRWILINGLLLALIYVGFVLGIQGAKNLSFAGMAFVIILTPLLFSERIQERMTPKGRVIPKGLASVFDILAGSILIWFGSWVFGTLWIIHRFLIETAIDTAAEKNKSRVSSDDGKSDLIEKTAS